AHGLVLGQNGKLYDSKKGEALPEGISPMPVLSEIELKDFPEPGALDVVPGHVARYWDMWSMAQGTPAQVIGDNAMLRDKPGFGVEFIRDGSLSNGSYAIDRHEVLMAMRGHWRLTWDGGMRTLAPGDTCAVPPGLARSLEPAMTGEASLFRVRATDDPAGPTWRG
ncbi:MAG: cupin, partial [Pseudomonadota bacterium]